MKDNLNPEKRALSLVKLHQDNGLDEDQAIKASIVSATLGIELTRTKYWYDVRTFLNGLIMTRQVQKL